MNDNERYYRYIMCLNHYISVFYLIHMNDERSIYIIHYIYTMNTYNENKMAVIIARVSTEAQDLHWAKVCIIKKARHLFFAKNCIINR